MQKESYIGLGIIILLRQVTCECHADYNGHFSDTKLAHSALRAGKLWHINDQARCSLLLT